MRKIVFFCAVVLVVFSGRDLWAQSASGSGNIYFEETFFPKYVNENDTSSITTAPGVADETGLGFDTKTTVGYLFFNRSFLFGLSYNYYNLSTRRSNKVGGDPGLKETTTENQFGPTIGWLNGGFRMLFTYFLVGEKSVSTRNFNESGTTANATITNSDLSGYQLTIGYTFGLWGVEIGPSLLYTSRTYAKQKKRDKLDPLNDYSATKLYSENRNTAVEPMLSILFKF